MTRKVLCQCGCGKWGGKVLRPECWERAILRTVASTGEIVVSWRYRDYRLREKCRRMAKRGLLRLVRDRRGETVFERRSA